MDAEFELQRLRCGAQLESRNRASTLHKANPLFLWAVNSLLRGLPRI